LLTEFFILTTDSFFGLGDEDCAELIFAEEPEREDVLLFVFMVVLANKIDDKGQRRLATRQTILVVLNQPYGKRYER
jgi:hypothetical protein